MTRYWRSSLAVFLGVSALGAALAYGLPAVYESTAEIRITAPAGAAFPEPAGALRALFVDHAVLEKAVHDATIPNDGSLPLASVNSDAKVTTTSAGVVGLSFRAAEARQAQKACSALADVAVAYLSKGAGKADRDETARQQQALADFVKAHPDVLLAAPAPSASVAFPGKKAAPPPQSDVALNELRKQKAILEIDRAAAQAATLDPSKANPYDDSAGSVADLDKRINELKYAIAARQKAASAGPAPARPSPAGGQVALQGQLLGLVKSLIGKDGTHAEATLSAQIIRPATLPEDPVKPNRKVIVLVGVLSGIWLAVLAALAQVVRADKRRQRAAALERQLRSDRPPAIAGPSDPPRLAPVSTVPPAGPPPARTPSDRPDAAEGTGPITEPIPKGPETRIGMMDPALFRTQIGGTPAGLLSQGAPIQTPMPPAPAVVVTTGTSVETSTSRTSLRSSAMPSRQASTEVVPGIRARQGSAPPGGIPRGPSDRSTTQRISTNPPRPPSDRPRSVAPASVRPSRIPLPAGSRESRASEVFAPPPFIPKPPATGVDFQQAPSTQRFGSLEESLPKTISPPPPPPSGIPRPDRPDTKYSFVDRSRTSRPPPVAERPSQIPNPTAARTRADASSSRPAAPVATQESIIEVAQPTKVSVRPPETEIRRESSAAEVAHSAVVEGEVWEKVSTRRPPAQELVVPQRVPSSWRFDAVVSQENGYAALTGLRDQIFGFAAHSSFVLGVTSESSSQEKKTDVAARITAMLSQDGRARVLLMEADFEHPTIHRVLSVEMPPGGGFSQQLRARLRPGPKKPWTVMRCTDKLDVLAEGSIRTPGVLMSQEFANAVAELRSFYDVIVIDSPVDGSGGLEMKPIDAVTDGIAIVAPDAASLREALDRGMSWFGQKKLMVSVPATGMP